MASKAERLRNKKRAKLDLPGLAPIEKKQPHRVGGKFARDDDPRKTALTARQRRLAMDDYRKDQGRVTDPLLGAEIGYVIRHECKEREASQLWDVWQQYCAAQRAYRMRILGTTGEPKGAAIQMVPDAMQSDTSMRVDMRSDDERDRQAVSGYMRWKGWLWCLTAAERGLIHHAERGTGKPLWHDHAPTRTGVDTLNALKLLAQATKA